MSSLASLPLALVASFGLVAAPIEEERTGEQAESPADPRAMELPEWSRDEVKAALTAYKAATKRESSPTKRIAAMAELATGRHADVSKELKGLLNDKDIQVRIEAVRLLGTQRGDKCYVASPMTEIPAPRRT